MDPVTDATAAGALLGIKPLTVLGAAVGGVISLSFFDGQSRRVKWMAALGGVALAALLAEPLTLGAGLSPKVETAVSVFIAMFGMSIVTALAKALQHINWVDVFWAVLAKFGFNKPPSSGSGGQP